MSESDFLKNNIPSNKERLVFLALVVGSFVTFFLPYRVKYSFGGKYTTLFGSVHNASYSVEKMSGFESYLPLISIFFLVVIALMLIYSRKKSINILALVLLVLYWLFLLFLYALLTFHLNFSNQRIEVKVGIGYFLLILFSILFTIQSIMVIIKTWKSNKPPTGALSDLLDEF